MTNNQLNKARFAPMNDLWPVINWELYDKEQGIWRGELLPCYKQALEAMLSAKLGRKQEFEQALFFSRKFDPNNDIDKMVKEYLINKDLYGIPVLLVHKEKFLFTYGEPTAIIIPPRHIQRRTQ